MKEAHKVSLFGLVMVVAGSCIGIGIFLVPAMIAQQLPSPGWILIVWVVGGLSTLSAAFTFGELASRFPSKAGIYHWLKETYGDFWGFLFGWFYLIVLVSGAIAAISLGFAQYAAALFPIDALGHQTLAVGLIAGLCIINCLGLKWGDWSTRLLALLKIGGLLLIIGAGIFMGTRSPSLQIQAVASVQSAGFLNAFGIALVGVSFSYAGIQYATFIAAEARNPARNVALGMTIGVLIVTLLYVLTNYAYLKLVPVHQIAASDAPAAAAVAEASPALTAVIPLIIMISAAGTVASFTLAAPRMYQSMAEEGLFFGFLMKKHAAFGTPVNAIVSQSIWAIFWVLFWGTFAGVITHLVITNLVFTVMAALSVYVLRKRTNSLPVFTSPGYPFVPAFFIIVSVFIISASTVSSPSSLAVSTVFVGVGWVIYRSFVRNQKPET